MNDGESARLRVGTRSLAVTTPVLRIAVHSDPFLCRDLKRLCPPDYKPMNADQLGDIGRDTPGKINKLVTSEEADSSLSGPGPSIFYLSAAALNGLQTSRPDMSE